MTVLRSTLDTSSDTYRANREALLEQIAAVEAEHAKAVAGGGPKYVDRHRQRGKLLVRERIELLVDEDSPFLELSPLAGWGSEFHVGASVVTGIGVVEGVECLISGSDPTVKGGASNPWTLRKILRANEIACRTACRDQPHRVRRRLVTRGRSSSPAGRCSTTTRLSAAASPSRSYLAAPAGGAHRACRTTS